ASLCVEPVDLEAQHAPALELGRGQRPVADGDVQLLEIASPKLDLASELPICPWPRRRVRPDQLGSRVVLRQTFAWGGQARPRPDNERACPRICTEQGSREAGQGGRTSHHCIGCYQRK